MGLDFATRWSQTAMTDGLVVYFSVLFHPLLLSDSSFYFSVHFDLVYPFTVLVHLSRERLHTLVC